MYKLIRGILAFLGVVAVIVGVVGLLAPVSVSPEGVSVRCGSAVAADLSAARAHDDGSAANVPVPGGVVTDTNFEQLCRQELTDRRVWTITLAAAGGLAVVAAFGLGTLVRQRQHSA